MIFRELATLNAVMVFTTLSTRISVKGLQRHQKKQKLFLMSWCPETAGVKKKMLYSSSVDALRKALVGVQKFIQATDASEADKESVEEKLRSTDRN